MLMFTRWKIWWMCVCRHCVMRHRASAPARPITTYPSTRQRWLGSLRSRGPTRAASVFLFSQFLSRLSIARHCGVDSSDAQVYVHHDGFGGQLPDLEPAHCDLGLLKRLFHGLLKGLRGLNGKGSISQSGTKLLGLNEFMHSARTCKI